jgi:hypothetical protein
MSGDTIEQEPFALLTELDTLLSKLACTDLTALAGPQVLEFTRQVERVVRRTVTVQHAAAAELDARHAAAETGHHSTVALLTDLLRIDPGQARRRVKDAGEFGPRRGLSGEPLPPVLPQTADALADGTIGIEHARAISDLFTAIPGRDADSEQETEATALQAAAVCTGEAVAANGGPPASEGVAGGGGACRRPAAWTRTAANPKKSSNGGSAGCT